MAVKRPRFVMTDVRSLLDAAEVTGLRDEISEWKDNLEGANMEHLPKYEEVSECFEALDYEADDLERAVEDLIEFLKKSPEGQAVLAVSVKVRTQKARASRADRLSDATSGIELALGIIEERFGLGEGVVPPAETAGIAAELEDAISDVRDHLGNLDSVDFPGMY